MHRPGMWMRPRWVAVAWLLAGGCQTPAESGPATAPTKPAPSSREARFSPDPTTDRLVLLHTSDNESDLLGHSAQGDSDAGWGGTARAAAILRTLRAQAGAPVATVAAGDTLMPAPEMKIELDGKNAVAEANNLLGFKASALGNHEFDLGEAFLAEHIRQSSFPYLSATLDFVGGPLDEIDFEEGELTPDEGWVELHPGRVMPRGKLCAGGELSVDADGRRRCSGLTVGVVGATTDTLRAISNISDHVKVVRGLDGVQRAVQRQVDALLAEGVNKIVLLSHMQSVRRELDLIDLGLVGVDLIVAGGGDNRLADRGDRLLPGAEPDPLCAEEKGSCYPVLRQARDDRPVLVVATDGQVQYIGLLSVSFDAQGVLTGFDATSSRPWPVDEASLVELRAEPARDALAFEARVRDTLAPLLTPFAHTDVFLDGTRESVRNRETNLGDLSTDALVWAARQATGEADIAFGLRNGGGIRAAIGTVDRETYRRMGSPLRPLDVQSALRFDNPIVILELTHQALKETLESSFRGAGTGRGHFPQVSSEVKLSYTTSAPEQTHVMESGKVVGLGCPGARLRELAVVGPGGKELPIVEKGKLLTPDARIKIATLQYLAGGGDAWFPGRAATLAPRVAERAGQPVREQDALRDYILHLEAEGRWQGGAGYPDVDPHHPEGHPRIRQIPQAASEIPDGCRAPGG